jgi:OmpA-OmpF porin, OOP family
MRIQCLGWAGMAAVAWMAGAASAQTLPGWYGGIEGFANDVDDTSYDSRFPPVMGEPGDPMTQCPSPLGLPLAPLNPLLDALGLCVDVPGAPGDSMSGPPYSLDLRVKNGAGGSFLIGYSYESGLRPEVAFSYRRNDLEEIRFGSQFGDNAGDPVPGADGELESLSFMGNLWFDLKNSSRVTPYLGGGVGFRSVDLELNGTDGLARSDKDSVFAYQVGAGVGFALSPRLSLSVDARYFDSDTLSLSNPNGDPASIEYTGTSYGLGLRYVFAPSKAADSDGDGVPDFQDRCPNTPSGVQVDRFGCPLDSDGDGVPDHLDECPNTPAGATVNAKGCPIDTDGDGVPDYLDKCPGTPQGMPVNADGCPIDSDGDGVPDHLDKCPGTPAGVEVDADGCPAKDSDGDGVPDFRDLCPNTPKGIAVGPDGCPLDSDGDGIPDYLDECPNSPAGAVVLPNGCALVGDCRRPRPGEEVDARGCAVDRSFVLKGVKFEFDSAVLTEEAKRILDRVSETLIAYPEINVELEGHTDNVGTAAYNLGLSERRSITVKNYLAAKGVAESRMVPVGYGLSQPIADNTTEEGREENRRVELTVRD